MAQPKVSAAGGMAAIRYVFRKGREAGGIRQGVAVKRQHLRLRDAREGFADGDILVVERPIEGEYGHGTEVEHRHIGQAGRSHVGGAEEAERDPHDAPEVRREVWKQQTATPRSPRYRVRRFAHPPLPSRRRRLSSP